MPARRVNGGKWSICEAVTVTNNKSVKAVTVIKNKFVKAVTVTTHF